MTEKQHQITDVRHSGALEGFVRRHWQIPEKILAPFVRADMTVLDVGCGPGYFTVPMARMVGPTGKVIAADLQDGMLRLVADKVRGTDLEARVDLVRCRPGALNVTGPVDFILALFVVHEVSDKQRLFGELSGVLRPGGRLLLVEPRLFEVSRKEFVAETRMAGAAGFTVAPGPRLSFCRSAILEPEA